MISGGDYAGAYSYDLFGMQITYSLDGTSVTYYTYRPDGLRHSIQGKAHAWDNGNIVADMGAENVYYIRALTLVYARDGSTKTYYRFNGHGDVIALANAGGAVIKRYKYDAFGVEENPDVFDTNVFRYCAEYYDIETKTVYLRARYYDAETGRFTQQDGWNYAVPGFPLSLNLYTYCNNDPIKYADPSGHSAKEFFNNVKNKLVAIYDNTVSTLKKAVEFVDNSADNIINQCNVTSSYLCGVGSSVISCVKGDTNLSDLWDSFKGSSKKFAGDTLQVISDQYHDSIDLAINIEHYIRNTADILEIPTEDSFIGKIKNIHYSRNENQPIEELPQTEKEAQESGWSRQDDGRALCHQNTALAKGPNVKYLSGDGHREVIYDADGNMVTAPEDMGTYNGSPPNGFIGSIGHFFADMLPWYLWGNSPDDSTTTVERIVVPIELTVRNWFR